MTDWRSEQIGLGVTRCPPIPDSERYGDVNWVNCDRCGQAIRDYAGPRCFRCKLIAGPSIEKAVWPWEKRPRWFRGNNPLSNPPDGN